MQTSATNLDGLYRFTVLPAGTYEIVLRRDGFRTMRRQDVRLPSRATVVIDFTMEVSGISDQIEVRAQSPMVDVKSAAVPVRLDAEMLHNLPTPGTSRR